MPQRSGHPSAHTAVVGPTGTLACRSRGWLGGCKWLGSHSSEAATGGMTATGGAAAVGGSAARGGSMATGGGATTEATGAVGGLARNPQMVTGEIC